MPDACIGADVIVGAPGETDTAFANTVSFVSNLGIAYLHVFTYSERPGTTADDLMSRQPDLNVPKQIRRKRSKDLRLLSSQMRSQFNARFVGSRREVLWEEGEPGGSMFGFTDNYVKTRTPYDESRVGTVEEVCMSRADSDGVLEVDNGFVIEEVVP
jgi:threonylcarbamoyladenosine tRNA methylthiotransferase MtaB